MGSSRRIAAGIASLVTAFLVVSVSTASAARHDDSPPLEWPYYDNGYNGEQDEQAIAIMEAFGASNADARAAIAYETSAPFRGDGTEAQGTDSLPDAALDTEPSSIEHGESRSLSARISIYEDGSLDLSLVQTDVIDQPEDSVVAFESVTVDFSQVSDALVRGDMLLDDGDISVQSTPTGCAKLPNQGGWIRRADCYVYDSTNIAPVVSASFYFDYSVKSASGRIDRMYGAQRYCLGGSATGKLSIARKQNSGSAPARGNNTVICHLGGIAIDNLQQLLVLGTAWSTHNFNRD